MQTYWGYGGQEHLRTCRKMPQTRFPLCAHVVLHAPAWCVRERMSRRWEGQKECQGKLADRGKELKQRRRKTAGQSTKETRACNRIIPPKSALRQLPAIHATFGKASLTAGEKMPQEGEKGRSPGRWDRRRRRWARPPTRPFPGSGDPHPAPGPPPGPRRAAGGSPVGKVRAGVAAAAAARVTARGKKNIHTHVHTRRALCT